MPKRKRPRRDLPGTPPAAPPATPPEGAAPDETSPPPARRPSIEEEREAFWSPIAAQLPTIDELDELERRMLRPPTP